VAVPSRAIAAAVTREFLLAVKEKVWSRKA